jgi:hypothetical protein
MAIHWGDFKDEGCAAPGIRRWTSVLWDIPWGDSWGDACAATAAPAGSPAAGLTPSACVNSLHEWGVWLVPDTSCTAFWGSVTDSGCSAIGTRKFSAMIHNVPSGQTWEVACATTPGPGGMPGVAGRTPDRCINTGLGGMWGEWDVADTSCAPHWGALTGGCVATGLHRSQAILWDIPANVSWTVACLATPAPAGTALAGQLPTSCRQDVYMWGFWDVPNSRCVCTTVPTTTCRTDPSGGQVCETRPKRVCHLTPTGTDQGSLQQELEAGVVTVSMEPIRRPRKTNGPTPTKQGPSQS